jgi:hypothetical protein
VLWLACAAGVPPLTEGVRAPHPVTESIISKDIAAVRDFMFKSCSELESSGCLAFPERSQPTDVEIRPSVGNDHPYGVPNFTGKLRSGDFPSLHPLGSSAVLRVVPSLKIERSTEIIVEQMHICRERERRLNDVRAIAAPALRCGLPRTTATRRCGGTSGTPPTARRPLRPLALARGG